MSDLSLPLGWVVARIGDIAIKGQQRKPDPDEVFTYVDIGSIDRSKKVIAEPQQLSGTDAPSRARKVINTGDILVSLTRPNLNAVALVDERFDNQIASTGFEVIKPVQVDSRYIYTLVRSKAFIDEISGVVQGALYPAAKSSDVQGFHFPLPPPAEQKVIADKLDTLLAQVENTKVRLQRIPQLLKRFRQSVLAAAVTGKLTEDKRRSKAISSSQSPVTINVESDEQPEGWNWQKLVDLAILESGHTPRKSVFDYWENGDVPWISLQDIRAAHGKIIENTKHMPTMKGIENSSARLLPTGTVCFSRDISVGFTTIMGKEMSTTQHFANWICGEKLNNKYLMYALMAAKDHLTISGQGTTVKTIYMPALKEFRLLTPPLKEQTEIVHRVEQLLAYADTIEQQVNNALARVEKLTQSVLAKAFRGELTEQWRKDNPELISGENSAAALLERIQTERAAAKPARKTRKKAG
ncbi:restriction endonuclease subunit S [Microbulbifer bruguierae]|uniref:Restriction endonuclease subunit S n=1 Tax=Microbulbifer bruguierae TaxID=3029061 RepID=A0ABY8NA72_9GAMM|nr:restriction endonuclease subunit S [Microbulbifer bruguierae]WGL15809.1 restriction endonuclease subunit S [Microbulbifer bruguierae]